ncbi:hypothetical protein GTY54_46335, partial [Streptomyces sp. SID625]|nr:hypothetical protein [Streptomyces sp. SID625]
MTARQSPPAPAANESVPAGLASLPEFGNVQAEIRGLDAVLAEEPTAAARLTAGTDSRRPLSPGDIRVTDQDERVRQAEQQLDRALSPAPSPATAPPAAATDTSAAGQQTAKDD